MTYPYEPGVRARSTGGTAELARDRVRGAAKSYEAACLAMAEVAPITSDEAHQRLECELGRSIPPYSIKPRFSQLKARGLVKDSGIRRKSAYGSDAVAWMATTPEERALHNAREAVRSEKEGSE